TGEVLSAIAKRGVPNYFGEQRFGHGGANVERARVMFAGRRMDRTTRSMLLSAARSQIFNEVLATRVRDGNWDRAIDGEVWCLAGSHARFGPEALNDVLQQRLAEGDIHPSGPLWGRGDLPTQAQARQLEQDAAAAWQDLAAGLEQAGLEQDRRPLRLIPRHLHWRWLDENSLELSFSLPPGTYATVLMRELADAPQQASIS
ncbi:MAG TPA: tRNA pseudouridine(13) synthase TruD, partial [Oleiagrimonas sp.]|nr:tRNA pseudouridine(13) synthase TruD [Oleiagrimonas sp.]